MITIQASNLNRLIACSGSIRMVAETEPEDQSEAAREGVALHAVLADVLRGKAETPTAYIDRKMPNGVFVTSEMAEAVGIVLNGIYEHGSDPLGVELTSNWQHDQIYVYGRADHICYEPMTKTLFVDDAKFGWRLVNAADNWTMLSYAYGYCTQHRIAPDRVVMTIHQPRPHHEDGKSRPWELTWDEFEEWCGRLLEHISKLTMDQLPGISDLVTGSHCYNCRAAKGCPALRASGMNLVEMSAEAFTDEIPTDQLGFVLHNLQHAQERLGMLIEAYQNESVHRIKAGAVIDGYVIENPQGNRFWKKEFTPEMIEALTGKQLTDKKMITPAEAARRGVDETVLALLTDRARLGEKLKPKNINKLATKAFGGN